MHRMQCILVTLNFLTVGITLLFSLTSYHILEDKSLQLSTDPDKYVVDMEPKDSRLKVKFAIKVPNGL